MTLQFHTTRTNRHMSTLTGVETSEPLGQFPTHSVTKDLGYITSDMTVIQYAQQPNFFYSTTSSAAGTVYSQVVHPMRYYNGTTHGRTNPDYLAFASSLFDFWRGSIRFLIQFVGTAFYSCTYRISVYHGETLTSGDVTNIADGVPLFSRIVNAKGDTWTEVDVPYLQAHTWGCTDYNVEGPNSSPYLLIEALTAVQGSNAPATAIYYVNIYRGAGSDFQLANLKATTYADSYQEQCSLNSKFQGKFTPIAEGMTGLKEAEVYMSDQATTCTDTLHRWAYVGTTPTTPRTTFPEEVPAPTGNQALFWWNQGFAYWRGSRRWKNTTNQASFTMMNSYASIGYFGMGYQVADGRTNSETGTFYLNVDVPYFSLQHYYPTIACNSASTIAGNSQLPTDIRLNIVDAPVGDGYNYFLSAGDDFIYLHPIAPQPFAIADGPIKSAYRKRTAGPPKRSGPQIRLESEQHEKLSKTNQHT